MADLAELGIVINTQPMADGVKALDAVGEASVRVENKANSAAKSVDGLGEAAARTGQRAAVSNGQMSDTAKIMQMQAEQARAATQANAALGNSSGQLTLGQQQLIEKMREQVAVLGMSRAQLMQYQAAQLGVSNQTQDLIARMKQYEDATRAATEASKKAAEAKREQEAATVTLTGAIHLLVAGYAALKVGEYVKESALLAARYETLGVVMEVVGRNAGYTKTQMMTATQAIAAQGITMVESRESAVKLVQAHVDLKHATALARIAQDAAVIGHMNSSDAFDRLVNGIARGNVLILRNIGINVNLQTAYRQMAEELGKSTKELTENERVQARLSAVLQRGTDIAGTYEAAMGTASKQITSMQRYVQDLKTVVGEIGLEVLTVSVMGVTKGFKDANAEMKDMSANGELKRWGENLTDVLVGVANSISNIIVMTKLAAVEAAHAVGADGGKGIAAPSADDSFGKSLSKKWFSLFGASTSQGYAGAEKSYAETVAGLTGQLDQIDRALVERRAANHAKDKAEADARLKVDAEYSKAAAGIFAASAGQGMVGQALAYKKAADLYRAIYVGTPDYRDTEGREPKPKVDQAENTRMADKLARIQETVNAEKSMIDQLSKIDDLWHKAGLLGDQKFYKNKRDYAEAAANEEVAGFDAQIAALRGHNSATAAEAAKHAKQINDIIGKKAVAEQKSANEIFLLDQQEMLRKDAIINAADAAGMKEIATINAQVAAVQEQIRTYNMLPAAKTAVAIADLQEQSAALAGFEGSEKTIELNNRKIESLERLAAAQGALSKLDTGSDVAKAKELLDILTAVDTATKSAAASMADSFGRVGSAIGGLTTALSGYAVQQQAIAAQLAAVKADPKNGAEKIAQAEIAASKASAQAKVKSYGDMANAAKGFFKENSTGYKVMEATEKAFRAAEMAMAIEAMVRKIFFKEGEVAANVALNGTKLAGEAATTAASTGLAATEASAWGVTAVVKALASLPFPANLAAGAATLAAVVAIGATLAGGIGGGSSGGGKSAADVQKAQGTGSVFGDNAAKSDSIARSLGLLEDHSGDLIPINRGMLTSLRAIEAQMKGLTNLVVRAPGVIDASNMGIEEGSARRVSMAAAGGLSIAGAAAAGMAVAGPIGAAAGALAGVVASLWGKTKTNIVDSGIQFGGSVNDLQAGKGYSQYASVDTTKSSWFGLSKKTSNAVQTQGLDGELSAQFGLIFTGLENTLTAAAVGLGMGADQVTKTLDALTIDVSNLSLKGLSGDALTEALNAVLSKAMDQMSAAVFPELDSFRQVGEGYTETVIRLASNYAQLDAALAANSWTFGAVGASSLAARERLIALAGGMDKLSEQSTDYAENFLTEAQRLAPVQKYVTEEMARLGFASVTTRDQFKAAVDGLAASGALATAAGAETFTGLMAVEKAFAAVTPPADDMNDLLSLQAQMYEANGDKAGAAAVLVKQHALALEGLSPAMAAATKAAWDAQAAEKSRQETLETAAALLQLEAQTHEANGNKAGVAAVLVKQHAAALAILEPALRAATQELWNAQAAEKARADQLALSSAMFDILAQTYVLTGNKAGAAAVLQAQHAAALAALDPTLRSATQNLWALQAAAAGITKARGDAAALVTGVDESFAILQRMVNKEKELKAAAHQDEMKALEERIKKEVEANATAKKKSTEAAANFKALSDSIHSALDQMHVIGNEGPDRSSAQAQVQAALATARAGGGLPTAESMKAPLSTLGQDTSDLFSTKLDYERDFYKTQRSLQELGALSDSALTVEEKTLEVLEEQKSVLDGQKELAEQAYKAEIGRLDGILSSTQQQIDVLKGIDTTGLTLVQAIEGVRLAIVAAAANPVAGAAAPINDAYKESLGRAPDKAGMEYWQNQVAGGATTGAVVDQIANSKEAQVRSLYKNLLGREPDNAGLIYFLNSGSTVNDIERNIRDSDEYKSRSVKVPGFAAGGDHMGGLRFVGEQNVELEATGPSRIHTASQLMDAMRNPASNNAALAAAVERLTATVERQNTIISNQQATLDKISSNTGRGADMFERVTEGGDAMRTKEIEVTA